MWKEFLGTKFAETERERLRENCEALSECDDPEAMLTREAFNNAVKSMKNGKAVAVGVDNIPAEVWKNSKVTQPGRAVSISPEILEERGGVGKRCGLYIRDAVYQERLPQ